MKNKIIQFSVLALAASVLLAACGSIISIAPAKSLPANQPAASAPQQERPQAVGGTSLSAYETALENIYIQVNPSVVSIRVVQQNAPSQSPDTQGFPFPNIPGFPNFFGSPNHNNNQQAAPQFSETLGSGFIWDKEGYIITNNHVISGANKIEVKFADGTTVPAKLIGANADSDLAVIKIDNPGFDLTAITISDSTNVKVGQLAVAIGNPFGLENTMTVGIVSALGRTLPSSETGSNGLSYSIPDIIQTDAPINPGNSGGPLVDDQGALIGVTSAIESPVRANSGVGFAIPSTIVSRVVPELIKNGKYEQPFLGISGTSLTPDLSKAMSLSVTQRGALVVEVTPGGPADKAGVHGSDRSVTIDGQDTPVGGDVITAVEGTAIKSMDDLIAFLTDKGSVGQKISLSVLRNGKEQSLSVTLQARPAKTETNKNAPAAQNGQASVWLGIAGQPLTAEINQQMHLPDNQSGILVEQVQSGSPADKAGLQGSFKPVLINGQRVLIDGDVITAIDGNALANVDDLRAFLQNAQPGQQVQLAILRGGKKQTLTATLAAQP
ncbi:MAG TPA: trypsin-like peptidase domain-containing protein [Anaerolineales bacterium]|jgi:S1-C subfamily serine protease